MKQINLYWVKNNWQILVITLLLLLLAFQCNQEPSLAENHKSNAKEQTKIARQETKKSIDIVNDYKIEIAKKNLQIANYQKLLAISENKVKAKLSDLKQYKNSSIVVYYKDRYNVIEGVKSIDTNTIAIKDNVSRLVISDLIKYDGLKYDNPILKSQLNTVSEKFIIANNTIDTLKISINNISSAYESANNSNELAIKQVEKQVKQERRKKNFWKYASIVVASGLGYLYITK